MEENFRLVLIIISAVVIGAILIHGLWTIRKNKNPYKLKTSKTQVEPEKREFDSSGFDQTGVSTPKVIGNNDVSDPESQTEPQLDIEPKSQQTHEAEPAMTAQDDMSLDDEKVLTDPVSAAVVNDALEGINKTYQSETRFDSPVENPKVPVTKGPAVEQQVSKAEPTPDFFASEKGVEPAIDPQPNKVTTEQTFQEPEFSFSALDNEPELSPEPVVSNFEREVSAEQQAPVKTLDSEDESLKAARKTRRKKGNDNQFGFDFEDEPKAKVELEPEVIAISVTMPEGQYMSGAALLPCLLTLGLRYGDMEIFHRHQDNAGNGAVTFSLANMLKPGTFDLDRMESFATKGVTLFMTLPNEGDAFEVFEQLLSAAKHLAQEFNGQLLDSQRSVMTKQTEQHYLTRIREFERKARIAGF